jgi:hypothetical protein
MSIKVANLATKNHLFRGDFLERVEGIEPSSQAWKARIISHYTIPAELICGAAKLASPHCFITGFRSNESLAFIQLSQNQAQLGGDIVPGFE